jgi:NAD-dependent SIR2 family protein deacetylase
MKLYPFTEVAHEADAHVQRGHTVFQQFNCAHCGTKQTMEEANKFHTTGQCEECGKLTDIKKDGCNFMLIASGSKITY